MENIITLDYGSGGKKTDQLIRDRILPLLDNEALRALGDGAVLPGAEKLVFSTDSFVVSPYRFPGGDIGKLAVCGTVNDVSMAGGAPKYLSLSLIIEEGFPLSELDAILTSIQNMAGETGVQIVTGDTKVVERGRGDGIYINTAGIGFLATPGLSPKQIQRGDVVIVSGTIGEHGTAVMLARNEKLLRADVRSDCAPLHEAALALGSLGEALRCMRDPTRGGLATTLNEFIEGTDLGLDLAEADIPVSPTVQTVCDMLGLDPLYNACEGRLLAVVAPERADEALAILRNCPHTEGARVIGSVTDEHPGRLVLRTEHGGARILTKLTGTQLPRIC